LLLFVKSSFFSKKEARILKKLLLFLKMTFLFVNLVSVLEIWPSFWEK